MFSKAVDEEYQTYMDLEYYTRSWRRAQNEVVDAGQLMSMVWLVRHCTAWDTGSGRSDLWEQLVQGG